MRTCNSCPYLDDVDRNRRNPQFDTIYCIRCKDSFERRMQPWHCPYSTIVKKENIYCPDSCNDCPYSSAEFCELTGKDMQICTSSFRNECPLYNEEKMPK